MTTPARRFALSVLSMLPILGVGCGPEVTPPGAAGEIALLPGVEATGFTHAHIRLGADADGGSLNLNDLIAESEDAEASVAIEELPMSYSIEHGDESSDAQMWRVTVWLSTSAEADAPADGDLVGSDTFELERCGLLVGDPVYCGTQDGVDVLIDAVVQVQ